jgi:hypothetical protein
MAKYSVVFGATGVELKAVDGKAKPFADAFVSGVALADAMLTTKQEIQGRGELTRSMLSILVQVLQSPRIDGYRGKIALDVGLDSTYKELMRQAECDTLEPVFNATLDSKNAADLDKPEYKVSRTAQWSKYIQDLRAGGMYARAKATASLYMGYFGKLPCAYNEDGTADTSRLLGVTAMEKIIANAKTDLAKQENDGFSKRVSDLLSDMKAKTQKSHVGNVATALHDLKELTALFEALQVEATQKALATHQAQEDAKAKAKNDADNKARAKALKEEAKAKAKADKGVTSQAEAAIKAIQGQRTETAPV